MPTRRSRWLSLAPLSRIQHALVDLPFVQRYINEILTEPYVCGYPLIADLKEKKKPPTLDPFVSGIQHFCREFWLRTR
ncbi:hypothetical protein L2E82_28369 [Cichorium intybus]|uniref:Uncharacterized protein n=1 Tax=Cichorium intybus TaxID=13427 RepID=A0ACB9CVR2_CICIN|nr:hypothetical protein L2E82_28369 [Cichorium intybus]